jgi:hypothetical protein
MKEEGQQISYAYHADDFTSDSAEQQTDFNVLIEFVFEHHLTACPAGSDWMIYVETFG